MDPPARSQMKGRHMKQYGLAGLLVLWLLGTTVPASSADGDFGIQGMGTHSCGTYLADATYVTDARSIPETRATDTFWLHLAAHLGAVAWVQGFVSYAGLLALNTAQPTDYRLRAADEESIEVWLGNYCHQQPLKTIADAAVALIVDLKQPKPPSGKR
jgi:hypothetical protein